jgi:hypothetical protein
VSVERRPHSLFIAEARSMSNRLTATISLLQPPPRCLETKEFNCFGGRSIGLGFVDPRELPDAQSQD